MTNLSLRDIPEELYQKIKAMAARERRSVNQQILVLLERSVGLSQRPSTQVLEAIDRTRETIFTRVGVMPDSVEQINQDRSR
ncbi:MULTISPECIES: hypothetical protein [Moorena]|uniref:Antitoxin FitA-like ribbon-helix-helix domain-containing protein n=1 Tax=Moorena producens 3L TaxID=489825 RepID=F4Y232_9CYAN|nr:MULTISPECIES: hypothetical protein [Moorena]NEQ17117.1 hypothetical protein [Moorena sp. SIO3E2]EGJ29324.1 hypothetical protein LYNGBM3L_65430 [Moorena producens 3L]NEP32647.1 hypothetical protein [Moorena sp. SIO3B2]NEP67834.1 hypothetical protein [Moorena sp. SIO3A5]NEQ05989.1 hypothetical protein [Moorena sp. SIO4E2]